jgi:TonB family protein
VQALIDTVGRVIDVEVVGSTGETLFEQAATTAVLQYRFRPYRLGGEVREVYAVVRFAFRIY